MQQEIKRHRFNIFPEMQTEDYGRLSGDIDANGCWHKRCSYSVYKRKTFSCHFGGRKEKVVFVLLLDFLNGEAVVIPEENREANSRFSLGGRYPTREEALVALDKARKPKFAIFVDAPGGDAFLSEEDRFSGNYKGSKYPNYSYWGEFEREEDARIELNSILARWKK